MRALLSFFTVVPAGRSTLEAAARSSYLLPVLGLLAGLPGAALALSGYFAPSGVASSLALGAVLLFAGLHHADGVLDVGDAFMVRGSPERRRAVLKDTRVGIGGLFALFAVYAPVIFSLSALISFSPATAAFAVLAAETASRSAMLGILCFGRPAEKTSSAVPFVEALKKRQRRNLGLGLAVVLPLVAAVPLGILALPAAALWIPAAVLALYVSRRAFGGIGGDVSGATGELTRTLVLIVLSVVLLPGTGAG